MHGSGHIVGALGTRAERIDLSGRLIVGGCPLMPRADGCPSFITVGGVRSPPTLILPAFTRQSAEIVLHCR